MEQIVVNYTQDQIDTLMTDLKGYYSNIISPLTKEWLFATSCCLDMCEIRKLYLYKWVLKNQINYDILTIEELNYIVDDVKEIIY